jgi:uncharacterized membrane protein SpoIIM required for sporulation
MSTPDTTPTNRWIEERMGVWQQVASRIKTLESGRTTDPEIIRETLRLYPELAHDIATARRVAPESQLVRTLEGTYARVHQLVYQPPRNFTESLRRLVRHDLPVILFGMRWRLFVVTMLFVLSTLAGWMLVMAWPETAGLFASPEMMERVESGELWTDHLLHSAPSSVISAGIFTNNVSVAFLSIGLGVLFGLGTIYIIGMNGMMLGSVFALTAQHDLAGRLFSFVIAHGVVELAAIVLCGTAGFVLGESLARPGLKTRRQAFRDAASGAARIALVCAVFLIGAGIIEGYISPNPVFPPVFRMVVGVGYGVLFFWVLAGMPNKADLSEGRLLSRFRQSGSG